MLCFAISLLVDYLLFISGICYHDNHIFFSLLKIRPSLTRIWTRNLSITNWAISPLKRLLSDFSDAKLLGFFIQCHVLSFSNVGMLIFLGSDSTTGKVWTISFNHMKVWYHFFFCTKNCFDIFWVTVLNKCLCFVNFKVKMLDIIKIIEQKSWL